VGVAGTPATITGVLGFNNTLLGFSTWDHPAHMIFVRPDSPIAKRGKGHFPKYPEIYGTTEDYRGIRILGPRGTLGHLQVMATLAAVGLTEDDVEIIHMEIPAAFQAFKAGEGDATMTWSTFSPMAVTEGWVEASGATKAGFPVPAIIQATEKIMGEDPETVQKIVNVLFRALMYYQGNKPEVIKMYEQVCQDEGIASSPEFARDHILIHDAPSLEEFEAWLANDGQQKILDKIMEFYMAAGSYNAEQRRKIWDSFDVGFLRKAVENYKSKYAGK
jgi:ABC-type nitrate/sulfonate/bicarbonate transport system substrate-binding protein